MTRSLVSINLISMSLFLGLNFINPADSRDIKSNDHLEENKSTVSLISLDAEKNDDYATIKWSTTYEENVAFFILIRKDQNRNQFRTVGKISGQNYSHAVTDYKMIDHFHKSITMYQLLAENSEGITDTLKTVILNSEPLAEISIHQKD